MYDTQGGFACRLGSIEPNQQYKQSRSCFLRLCKDGPLKRVIVCCDLPVHVRSFLACVVAAEVELVRTLCLRQPENFAQAGRISHKRDFQPEATRGFPRLPPSISESKIILDNILHLHHAHQHSSSSSYSPPRYSSAPSPLSVAVIDLPARLVACRLQLHPPLDLDNDAQLLVQT